MKILLLLALKCFTYLKISADRIDELHSRDILCGQITQLDECSNPTFLRIERDSSSGDFQAFDPGDLNQSPRRKRQAAPNQNKIFFRRRKKKLYRQSRIRKSLFRRGKLTTATPYRVMRKYVPGKGRIARPPGLKYRKAYRFNRFKKTQDVALGIGTGGRAKVQHSRPRKRAPIHVRDYERRQATRKTFKGRAGDRKLPGDRDRLRKGADPDQKRRRTISKKSDSEKDYYDELSSYEDSLPKHKKTYGKTTKTRVRDGATKRKKVTKSDYSDDDNTLLLSDEDQLTDVSSDISDLRSELPDERPKHRKNASSSEYEQYSFVEDDSAIVQGKVESSKDESLKRLPSSRKTTLLGTINFEQYDIKKLDASIKRVFEKKTKKNKAGVPVDDPFEDLAVGYQDETSYESESDSKQAKRKGQKSKKRQETPKKGREPKIKIEKTPPKTKSQKTAEKSDSYDDSGECDSEKEYATDGDYHSESGNSTSGDDYESSDEVSTSSKDYDSEDYTTDEDYHSGNENSTTSEEEYTSEDSTSSKDYGSEDEYTTDEDYDSENATTSEDYDSEDEYITGEDIYVEPSTPLRRIPTWKVTQHSTKEKLYEEYVDAEDQKQTSKAKKYPKQLSAKNTHSHKKSDETSSYESSEYDSEYSISQSEDEKQKSSMKPDSTSTTKKMIKTTPPKLTSKNLVVEKSKQTSDYESGSNYDEYSDSDASSQKKNAVKSGKTTEKATLPRKTTSTKEAKSKKSHDTSIYESEDYESDYSDKSDEEKTSRQPTTMCEKVTSPTKIATTKKPKSRKGDDSSIYDSDYSSESDEKKPLKQLTTLGKNDPKQVSMGKTTLATQKLKKDTSPQKITFTKESKSKKSYDSSAYESNYSDESDEKKSNRQPKTLGKDLKQTSTKKTSSVKRKLENKKLSSYESSAYSSDYSESSHSKKPAEKLPPKKLAASKKSPKITPDKKSKLEKNSDTYEDSDYNSEVTLYEEGSSNVASESEENLPKRATWPEEDLEQSVAMKTIDYDALRDELKKQYSIEPRVANNKKTTPSPKVTRLKTTPTEKRTKKGFTTLPTTTKGFDSEEALRNISSKAAAITPKHVFVYNTKRKAYELVSLQPISLTTAPVTSPTKATSMSTIATFVTSLDASEKTLKRRVVRKKTTSEVNDSPPQSTSHAPADQSGSQEPAPEVQMQKTTRKRSSRKTIQLGPSTDRKIAEKRTRKKTTRTESHAEEE